jgi:hypothetical protein
MNALKFVFSLASGTETLPQIRPANVTREVGRGEKRTIRCVFGSRVVSGRW